MLESEVIEKVNKVLNESFEIDEADLKQDAQIFEDLGLDSLDIVDLVVALQQEFGVNIRDDERVRTIRTVGDITNFIMSLQADGVVAES